MKNVLHYFYFLKLVTIKVRIRRLKWDCAKCWHWYLLMFFLEPITKKAICTISIGYEDSIECISSRSGFCLKHIQCSQLGIWSRTSSFILGQKNLSCKSIKVLSIPKWPNWSWHEITVCFLKLHRSTNCKYVISFL